MRWENYESEGIQRALELMREYAKDGRVLGCGNGRERGTKKAPRVAGHSEVSVAPHKSGYLWGVYSSRIRAAISLISRTRSLGT